MKRIFAIVLLSSFEVIGFSQSKTYWSSGGEMIFSFANISDNGVGEKFNVTLSVGIQTSGNFQPGRRNSNTVLLPECNFHMV